MLEEQINYDESETKEKSWRTLTATFSLLSELNFGAFVTEMIGRACTGLVV